MTRTASIWLVAGALLLTAGAATAHHSISAEFDTNKPVTFTGVVKKVDWMNPHIYTHVEVKNPDGSLTTYKVEGGPPNALYRQGWRKDSIKIGDTVTVSGIRAKIATSPNVGVATIRTSDGKTIFGTGGRGGGGGGRAAAGGAPPAQ